MYYGWLLVLAVLCVLAIPARAHGGVFVGIGVPPVYGYPYPYYGYPYPYYGPPYGYPYMAPYGAYVPYPVPYGTLPPGWVKGHWVLRRDPFGRKVPVWIPSHLR